MSCEYDVKCLDCDEGLGFDINHGDSLMRALVRAAPLLAQVADAAGGEDLSISVWGRSERSVAWFAKHRGHRLVVMDEYGRIDGTCGELLKCPTCGHSTERCTLPTGHEGPHVVIMAASSKP